MAKGFVRVLENGSHEFLVENYSLRSKEIGVNNPIESDEFSVGGRRWSIRFYPDRVGDAIREEGYTTLCICTKRSKRSEHVEFLYHLSLLDQSGEGNNFLFSSSNEELPFKFVHSVLAGDTVEASNFIRRDVLESPNSIYLKDDCLKFRVTVGVFELKPFINEFLTEYDYDSALSSANQYVFFRVADAIYSMEKDTLSTRFKEFLPYLPDACQRQDIVFPDLDSEILVVVLTYINRRIPQLNNGSCLERRYGKAIMDSCPSDPDSFACKMLAAADRFKLKALKGLCEWLILLSVSVESVGYLLHVAEIYNATELRSWCMGFAARNITATLESDGCKYLKENCPKLFQELADLEDSTLTSGEGVRNLGDKVLSTCILSFVKKLWPCASHLQCEKLKTKED